MKELTQIEFNKEVVITTKMLAEAYETEEIRIQQNFNNNKDKFIEGKHYYKLEGEQLKHLKNSLENIEEVGISKKTPKLILWTKRGASRHCKILGTDKAWDMFDVLEENYFNPQIPQISEKQQCILALYEGGAEAVTAAKRLSEIEVQEATKPLIDTIEEQKPKVDKYEEYVDSDGYIAPRQAAQILKLPHPTAQAFNKLLKEHRVQYKNGKNWVLYEDFSWMLKEGYCKQVPYIDSTGTTHYNLRWTPKGIVYISTNILDVT